MSVANLTGPRDGAPAVDVTLTAREESFTLASGQKVDGYTLEHVSPGPVIRATDGDLVQVTLVNENVPDGATLHWHGVDVPNAEDGVAGVTQDAVRPGQRHTYRFRAEHPGTYWYHSHQVSHEQVRDGLFGTLVIDAEGEPADTEVLAPVHTYDGLRAVAGRTGVSRAEVPAGAPARVRFVNTDNNPLRISVTGAPYKLLAIDGRDLNGADGRHRQGGRAGRRRPGRPRRDAARRRRGRASTSAPTRRWSSARPARPTRRSATSPTTLDLLSYGSPGAARVRPGTRPTGASRCASAAARRSSTAAPACSGRPTARSIPTCRCTWCAWTTWSR